MAPESESEDVGPGELRSDTAPLKGC